jgi:serine/threonine-protein kinase RsbW
MTRVADCVVQARMAELPQATAFVDAFCEMNGIARGDALRLSLIVEELFTNTVEHGHGGDSDAPIRVELRVEFAQLALLYEDAAPHFDPLARLDQAPPDLLAALDERRVGGLGIHLVVQMAASVRYAREDGRNRLRLVLQLGA